MLARLTRRLEMGHALRCATTELPRDLRQALDPLLSVHLAAGGDLSLGLDRAAASLEERAAFADKARAASSGALLSARMVAALPLLFVPFSPSVRGAFGDPFGVVTLVLGALLSLAGFRWMGRLVPRPPDPDPLVDLCRGLATLLRAGLPVTQALDVLASHPPAGLEAPLDGVRAHLALGASWRRALWDAPDRFGRIGAVIDRAQRIGVPAAESLEALASTLQTESHVAFEARMRRAPVLLVVPLTCCILPSYGLLAMVPFLRGVTLS